MKQDYSDEDLRRLIYAIIQDDVEMLKEFLTQNSEIPLIYGMTLLQFATQKKSFNIVKYLLQNHYKKNKDQQGKAFITACSKGYTDIVRLLIKFGCDPNLHDKEMPSPLMLACQSNFHETVDYLLESGACMKEISRIENEIKIPSSNSTLKELYDMFHKICNFTDEPTTMLIMACSKCNNDMLSLLLDHIDIPKFIKIDLSFLAFKEKLIKATYKACKKFVLQKAVILEFHPSSNNDHVICLNLNK